MDIFTLFKIFIEPIKQIHSSFSSFIIIIVLFAFDLQSIGFQFAIVNIRAASVMLVCISRDVIDAASVFDHWQIDNFNFLNE